MNSMRTSKTVNIKNDMDHKTIGNTIKNKIKLSKRITAMKNMLDGIHSQLIGAEDQFIDLEDKVVKNSQSKQQIIQMKMRIAYRASVVTSSRRIFIP